MVFFRIVKCDALIRGQGSGKGNKNTCNWEIEQNNVFLLMFIRYLKYRKLPGVECFLIDKTVLFNIEFWVRFKVSLNSISAIRISNLNRYPT